MRDLHCHLLPGVDDGSKSIESTKELLKQAHENGITDIMLTPHYILDSRFISNKKSNENIADEIVKYAKKEYDINIFLGNEVYFNTEMYELYKRGEISTLNDSRYMLIELPMYSKINNLKSIFFELISHGIVPILAHPERYTAYYKDYDFFMELREMGVLYQINYASIIGTYGSKAKKMATGMLKANLISFLGSDIHQPTEDKYINVEKAEKKIKKIVGEDKYIEIADNNFAKVIYNEEI